MNAESNDEKPTYRHRTPTPQSLARASGGAGGGLTLALRGDDHLLHWGPDIRAEARRKPVQPPVGRETVLEH